MSWGAADLDTYSVQAIDFDVTDRLGTQEAESSGLPGVWFSGLEVQHGNIATATLSAHTCAPPHLAGLQEEFDCSEAVDGIDPFQPQCDATRRTDFDRSAEIFFLATKFD
ncbi:hypothetical protein RQN9TF_03130 [Rhodococcus qingshengii]|uniref:hypothetical protein n=1 Tax=Rhodococcus qingshengii TaxID=334542 RepID=UPI002200C09B|nr:hypothetical protein [Rhodococcus qingshengii]BDQ18164.1 hypothetical protein RQN9TF_03130 [Rhodococcus qingshengii]